MRQTAGFVNPSASWGKSVTKRPSPADDLVAQRFNRGHSPRFWTSSASTQTLISPSPKPPHPIWTRPIWNMISKACARPGGSCEAPLNRSGLCRPANVSSWLRLLKNYVWGFKAWFFGDNRISTTNISIALKMPISGVLQQPWLISAVYPPLDLLPNLGGEQMGWMAPAPGT